MTSTAAERHSKGVRIAFQVAGHLCLALGVLGFILPLVPGTVFLLGAAACYAKGSQHFHDWLLRNKWFGPPIKDWQKHKAMTVQSKVFAIGTLLVGVGISVVFVAKPLWLKLALSGVAAGVTILILAIKTKKAK